MRRTHGRHTALAAAIALACGAAWAQDEDPLNEPVGHDAPVVSQEGDVARDDERVLEDDRIGDDIADGDELADEIEDEQELADKRQELERAAETAIEELRATEPEAAQALDTAYGYAVFDTTEGGFIVTGSGGSGVAKVNGSGEQTFMHVGGAGIGLGGGGENYKLVLVFPDQESYTGFVDGEWEAGASAQVAAGEQGAGADAVTEEDVQVYHLTDAGLIAQADVTGLRFWPSEDLNRTDVASIEDEQEVQ